MADHIEGVQKLPEEVAILSCCITNSHMCGSSLYICNLNKKFEKSSFPSPISGSHMILAHNQEAKSMSFGKLLELCAHKIICGYMY